MNNQLVSFYQYNINPENPEINFQTISYATIDAAKEKSSLIIFPELFLHGYNFKLIKTTLKKQNQDYLHKLSLLAKQNAIAIAGSFAELEFDHFYNTFIYFSPSGNIIHKYRKIHMFNPMREGEFFKPGDNISPFISTFGISGAAICYDLRFPEIIRNLAAHDARIIFIPAEWPKQRIDHWDTLLRARAIENQVFVIGVNCVGSTLGTVFGGHSAVISPWGETLGQLESSEGLLTVSINMDEVDRVRVKIPVWKDRRTETY